MRAGAFIALLLLPITATAASISRAEYLMGTVCEITAESADAAEVSAAFAEGRRVEALISTWRADSELSHLNQSGVATVTPETCELLRKSAVLSRDTDGAFNPLMRPLIDAWRTRAAGAIPTQAQLEKARRQAQLGNLHFGEGTRITLDNGAQIEEGGFGKGYAIDRMLGRISSPQVVINFGGQLFVRGEMTVSIADPQHRDVPAISFRIRNASLSTSSGSEKSFVIDGRTFTHIIDPHSGEALPPRGSASVLAHDGLTADAFSTGIYVMGPVEGLRWANSHGVAAVVITPDHHILVSAAFRELARDVVILDDHFTLKE